MFHFGHTRWASRATIISKKSNILDKKLNKSWRQKCSVRATIITKSTTTGEADGARHVWKRDWGCLFWNHAVNTRFWKLCWKLVMWNHPNLRWRMTWNKRCSWLVNIWQTSPAKVLSGKCVFVYLADYSCNCVRKTWRSSRPRLKSAWKDRKDDSCGFLFQPVKTDRMLSSSQT